MKKIDIVFPVLKEDAIKVLSNLYYIKQFINYDNIVFIGNDEVESEINKQSLKNIIFINENKMLNGLNFKSIKELIKNRGGNINKTGWYFQQFLKLGYSRICKNDYYLIWDSDTMPVKEVDMFNKNGIPIFHMKTEYHKPYFETISNLFDGKYHKSVNKSFISEHMIFKTKYVNEMLNEIENNKKIKGKKYWEKIINGITEINDLNGSGFAEFETYGTYVYNKYKDSYELVDWKSLREGIYYFPLPLNDNQIKWLAKQYDAVSFEKHDRLSSIYKLWNNTFFYNNISINVVTTIMWPFMMFRKYFINPFVKRK